MRSIVVLSTVLLVLAAACTPETEPAPAATVASTAAPEPVATGSPTAPPQVLATPGTDAPPSATPDLSGIALTEVPADVPESASGGWRVRRYEAHPTLQPEDVGTDQDVWYSRLVVERTDGSARWVIADEAIPNAVCGDPIWPLGWSAAGDEFFYSLPGCGEGCVRFVVPYGIMRLDLATGERRPLGPTYGELSPDSRFLVDVGLLGGEGALKLFPIENPDVAAPAIEADIPVPPLPTGTYPQPVEVMFGGPIWSPDLGQLVIREIQHRGAPCGSGVVGSALLLYEMTGVTSGKGTIRLIGRYPTEGAEFISPVWSEDGRIYDLTSDSPMYGNAGKERTWFDPATGKYGRGD
jgi:hypothetical protein